MARRRYFPNKLNRHSAATDNHFRITEGYKDWRQAVLRRDGRKCKMCKKRSNALNVHHIIRWADAPELRFDVNNGITLCKACHKKITGNENHYVELCRTLLDPTGHIGLQAKLRKMDDV